MIPSEVNPPHCVLYHIITSVLHVALCKSSFQKFNSTNAFSLHIPVCVMLNTPVPSVDFKNEYKYNCHAVFHKILLILKLR